MSSSCVYLYIYILVVCFDSSSPIFSRFVLVYVLDLPIKIHNNYSMPVSLMITKRTRLKISCTTNDAIRGRRQRSLLRPDDERTIYVYTLSRSIMTILSRLVYESDRTIASVYLYTLSHVKDIK
jgi:hypothetical protein